MYFQDHDKMFNFVLTSTSLARRYVIFSYCTLKLKTCNKNFIFCAAVCVFLIFISNIQSLFQWLMFKCGLSKDHTRIRREKYSVIGLGRHKMFEWG